MLVSRSSVYLSGDFRLTRVPGKWEDNLNTQKLIPIFAFDWMALVSFAGVAQTHTGLDVGDWVSNQLAGIDMTAKFDELPKRLLAADNWLNTLRGYRPLVFSIVGFVGRKPVAMVISNFTNLDGHIFDPALPRLKKYISRPKEPEVRLAGDRTAVRKEHLSELKKMLRDNRSPIEIEGAMAKINASAHDNSSTISRECVTGHLLPTGRAQVVPHGLSEQVEYLPGFVKRYMAGQGVIAFKRKVDEKGNPLPTRWKGMTATKAQGPRHKDRAMLILHQFSGLEQEIIGTPKEGVYMYTRIVGEDEPDRYTIPLPWGADNADGQPGDTTPVVPMVAGEQITYRCKPALRFEVGGGWSVIYPEAIDGLYIGFVPEKSSLIFATPAKVFDPGNPSEPNEVPAPESIDEWVTWFQEHPNLDASKPVPVSVGGAYGVWIDVIATSTPEHYPQYCGERPCVPLFLTSELPLVSFASQVGVKDRFVIVAISSKPVVIDISAPRDRFDEFLPKAQKVLDTVEWKDT